MATKRDLVEAYSFSRRRLVTAFVSGAPGGREVEPVRPGRTIIGGLALAVLLVLGAVIAGVFAPRIPNDWNRPGLIVAKDGGGRYIITEEAKNPILRPVINITSAKLILGDDAADPILLPSAHIAKQRQGEDIGILGAPNDVPAADRLVASGWTACTDGGAGIRLAVDPDLGVSPVDGGAFVVRNSDTFFLVAQMAGPDGPEAYRYPLPTDGGALDNTLGELGLPSSIYATPVSDQWLALFPLGGALSWNSFAIPNAGQVAAYAGGSSGLRPDAKIGDLIGLGDGSAVVLTKDGPAPLTDFALAVYRWLPKPHTPKVYGAEAINYRRAPRPYENAHWPDEHLVSLAGEACGTLITDSELKPRAVLGQNPVDSASSAGIPADEVSVLVQPGSGAYVMSGDWDTTIGTPYLIDSRGRANPLEGPETPGLLGYAGVDPPVVPDPWVELFAPGAPLSRELALCPPDPVQGQACD